MGVTRSFLGSLQPAVHRKCPRQMSFVNRMSHRMTLCSLGYKPAGGKLEHQLTRAMLQNATTSCVAESQCKHVTSKCSLTCKPVEAEECIPGSTSASVQIATAPGV